MTVEETAQKIKKLEIQGATNVALEAVKALEEFADKYEGESFLKEFEAKSKILIESRPTEPMMRNGIRYVLSNIKKAKDDDTDSLREVVKSASEKFFEYVEESREKIANIGSKRIQNKNIVLVHCHSSTLIKILKKALDDGKVFEVINTETRPKMQGRVTAKELAQFGIPVTHIVDSAVNYYMPRVDLVLVGADAITSDGSVVNKIGTSQIALSAKKHGVPLLVASETYKFDPETAMGEQEVIEQRDPKEVWDEEVDGVQIKNPAFDITDADYVDLIITEEGIMSPHAVYDVIRKKFPYIFESKVKAKEPKKKKEETEKGKEKGK
ncbi:ribose 1,5-bisphosphate isomerase [Candidatus Undinarchaeota archaeon]